MVLYCLGRDSNQINLLYKRCSDYAHVQYVVLNQEKLTISTDTSILPHRYTDTDTNKGWMYGLSQG